MKTKANYRVHNWQEYDAALKQRGSLTFWVSEEVIEQWCNEKKTGREQRDFLKSGFKRAIAKF